MHGLKPSVREMVAHIVHMLPLVDRNNYEAVKMTAVDSGKWKNDMLGESKIVVKPKVI